MTKRIGMEPKPETGNEPEPETGNKPEPETGNEPDRGEERNNGESLESLSKSDTLSQFSDTASIFSQNKFDLLPSTAKISDSIHPTGCTADGVDSQNEWPQGYYQPYYFPQPIYPQPNYYPSYYEMPPPWFYQDPSFQAQFLPGMPHTMCPLHQPNYPPGPMLLPPTPQPPFQAQFLPGMPYTMFTNLQPNYPPDPMLLPPTPQPPCPTVAQAQCSSATSVTDAPAPTPENEMRKKCQSSDKDPHSNFHKVEVDESVKIANINEKVMAPNTIKRPQITDSSTELKDGPTSDEKLVYNEAFTELNLPSGGEWFKVKVTSVRSIGLLYVQLEEKKAIGRHSVDGEPETLSRMNIRMNLNVHKMKKFVLSPVIGQLVVVFYDFGWHRARIIASKIKEHEVMFVDYGSVANVLEKYMREIEPQYLHLPFQAIPCTLSNIVLPALGTKRFIEGSAVLKEAIEGKVLLAKVDHSGNCSHHLPHVELLRGFGPPDVLRSVNEFLRELGVCG